MYSMWPLIHPTDRIASLEKQAKYSVDDIIVFRSGSNLIAHRIIYLPKDKKEIYLTRGDNNQESDGQIHRSQILGRVTKIKRGSRLISLDSLYKSQATKYLFELSKFHQLAQKLKLPYVILKGIPVYRIFTAYYPKHFIFDVDILIDKSTLPLLEQILKMLKYQVIDYLPGATEFTATKKSGDYPISLDIHFEPTVAFSKASSLNQLVPQIALINEEIWATAKNHHLTANHQFVYLLLHALHHSYLGTKRWEYLNRFASLKSLKQEKVLAIIKELKLTDLVYGPLTYLVHYYGSTPLSNYLINNLYPKLSTKLLSNPTKHLVRPWDPHSHLLNRAILLLHVFVLSPLPLYRRVSILIYSIIFFDFKIFKKASTSSLA